MIYKRSILLLVILYSIMVVNSGYIAAVEHLKSFISSITPEKLLETPSDKQDTKQLLRFIKDGFCIQITKDYGINYCILPFTENLNLQNLNEFDENRLKTLPDWPHQYMQAYYITLKKRIDAMKQKNYNRIFIRNYKDDISLIMDIQKKTATEIAQEIISLMDTNNLFCLKLIPPKRDDNSNTITEGREGYIQCEYAGTTSEIHVTNIEDLQQQLISNLQYNINDCIKNWLQQKTSQDLLKKRVWVYNFVTGKEYSSDYELNIPNLLNTNATPQEASQLKIFQLCSPASYIKSMKPKDQQTTAEQAIQPPQTFLQKYQKYIIGGFILASLGGVLWFVFFPKSQKKSIKMSDMNIPSIDIPGSTIPEPQDSINNTEDYIE